MKIKLLLLLLAAPALAGQMPTEKELTNSIGMKFVRIEPGSFKMGQIKTPLPKELNNTKDIGG